MKSKLQSSRTQNVYTDRAYCGGWSLLAIAVIFVSSIFFVASGCWSVSLGEKWNGIDRVVSVFGDMGATKIQRIEFVEKVNGFQAQTTNCVLVRRSRQVRLPVIPMWLGLGYDACKILVLYVLAYKFYCAEGGRAREIEVDKKQ